MDANNPFFYINDTVISHCFDIMLRCGQVPNLVTFEFEAL